MFPFLRTSNSIGYHFRFTRSVSCTRQKPNTKDAFLRSQDIIETLAAAVSPGAMELVKLAFAKEREKLSGVTSSSTLNSVVSTTNVFANRQLDMNKISAIGFDYDYTLASYKTALQHFIYDEAKYYLLVEGGYPEQLADLKFEKDFAVRGLTFDRRTGML
jgi:hypothetical protein